VSFSNVDFKELTADQHALINELRLVLFLGFLSGRNVVLNGVNAGHFVATSENFISVIQNFDVNNEYISEDSGLLVRKLDGGYKISEFKSIAPPYVSFPLSFYIDEILIRRLLKMRKRSKRTYDLILRSAETLFQAYYNDPFVSINARILLIASAFEILMQSPLNKARETFKALIASQCNLVGEKEYNFKSPRNATKSEIEKGTVKVIWAEKFFLLRNRIIHGDKVPNTQYTFKNTQHHLMISTMFYVFLIKYKIAKVIKTKIDTFQQSIIWGTRKEGGESVRGFFYEDNSKFTEYFRTKRSKKK